MTDEQRKRIVNEVLSWKGTRYAGHSAVKGKLGGVDCAQLVHRTFTASGVVSPDIMAIPTDYKLSAQQHKTDSIYRDEVTKYFQEIPESEVRPGDLILYKPRGWHEYGHAAIVVSWPDNVIHATARYGVTGSHGIKHPFLLGAEKKFYTLKPEMVTEE